LKESTTLINERIRAEKLQLIGDNGENEGIVSRIDALAMARDAGLDLVLLSDEGALGVPVAKIMDFGKVAYAKRKKLAVAKKKQKVIKIKEIKLRPKISDHDYQTKMRQGIQFLKDGMRIKITLVFRGREATQRAERGGIMFEKINQDLNESGLGAIIMEQDLKAGQLWSRVYFLKPK
jgi:translation initiation factor IF-3